MSYYSAYVTRKCPACGSPADNEPEVGNIDVECRRCGWIEGGPDDFGFVLVGEIPFAPPEVFAACAS